MHIKWLTAQTIKTMLCNAARRSLVIVALASVALLSAPSVNQPRPEPDFIPPTVESSSSQSPISVTFHSGDTLLNVLKRFGVQAPSAHALINKLRPLVNVRKIRAGDDVRVVLNGADRTVEGMEIVVDEDLIRVKATDTGWFAERREIPFVTETRAVRGTIKSSLYESGVAAGLSPQQILDLAKIFESEVDFFSDFHPGNDFSAIVEDFRYVDGRRATGRILAAELEAENDTFDAFYFASNADGGNYYNGRGEALRGSFLRAPLSYARISSPFGTHRVDPIFRTVRPHLAIDYAAPAGTPVVSIGAGRIEFMGWRNGYGNVVDIRHSENYMSRYAHFSRFANNLRIGQAINAGDVIGYVGQTGHATGPHLHFEFLRGGTKINFLAFHTPQVRRLVGDELLRFNRLRDQRLAMLHRSRETAARTAPGRS
jgi:murein DD-endopeptidase MepM/ murein hydrolase activator NlpD